MKPTISLMFCALPLVAIGMERAIEIPQTFHGRWASSVSHCTLGGESVLTIERSHIYFYESNGTVLDIRRPTPFRIEIDLELAGEGQIWRDTKILELSQDGRTLTDLTRQNKPRPWSRMRCS